METDNQILIKPDEIKTNDNRFFQIDFLKVIMIFLYSSYLRPYYSMGN